MSHNIDLQEIERKAQQSFYQDGLLEAFLGFFLLIFGAIFDSPMRGLAGLSVLIVLLFKPAMERIKKRHIYPRMGFVEFPPDDGKDAKGIPVAALIFVIIILGALAVFRWIMGADEGHAFWFTRFFPGFTGLILAIGPWTFAQRFGIKRWYGFAAMFVVGGLALPFLGFESGYDIIALLCAVTGIVMLLSGTAIFARFLHSHPVASEELPVENG